MVDAGKLARLARLREIERRRAAEIAAAAGGRHDRLDDLAGRSRALELGYAAREDACDGAALGALLAFRNELSALSRRAHDDADVARLAAEHAQLAFAASQRRRDLVDERLVEARAQLAERRIEPPGPNLARSVNRRSTAKPIDRTER